MINRKLINVILIVIFNNLIGEIYGQQKNPNQGFIQEEMLDYDISKAIFLYEKNQGNFSILSFNEQNRVLSTYPTIISDPVSIGLTYTALQGVITNLESTMRTVSGDVAAHLNNLLNTANAVLGQWDYRLSDRLDRTLRQLREQERRLVEDTEALIRMTQQTIRQVEIGALEVARVTSGEADILAYNIIGNLKRTKEARFVYGSPSKLRLGLNEPIIKVRGNYLGFKPFNFIIPGYDNQIIPISYNENEVSIKLPDDFLESINSETTIPIIAKPYSRKKRLLWFGYRYWQVAPKSVLVTLKPKIDFSISVSITPQAKLPTKHTFEYSFYDSDENCKADRRVDRTYVLPPSWSLNDVRQIVDLRNTSGPNCSSGLIGRGAYNSSEFSVVVEGRIAGCGYSGPFNTFCKGRGWWGYVLYIPSKSYRFQPIAPYEVIANIPNQNQRSFTFDYPLENIPTDNQEVKYFYKIDVIVKEGSSERKIEISDVNPNVEGFRTRMEDSRLILEIDPMINLLEIK
jgi:hypothetical protein